MAAVVSPPTTQRLTYADYRALPDDGKRYELVKGVLREMPGPRPPHQRTLGWLFLKIQPFVAEKKLGEVFLAPLDVHLGDDLVYQPDMLVIAVGGRAKVTEDDVSGPPDLVVEIVSPGSRSIDRKEKLTNYAHYGVRECWLVYPDTWFVEVFGLREGRFQLLGRYGEGETVRSEVLAGLEFPAEALFES